MGFCLKFASQNKIKSESGCNGQEKNNENIEQNIRIFSISTKISNNFHIDSLFFSSLLEARCDFILFWDANFRQNPI